MSLTRKNDQPVHPWRAQHLSLWLGPTDVPVLLDLIDTARQVNLLPRFELIVTTPSSRRLS